jgi:hypothetical protein
VLLSGIWIQSSMIRFIGKVGVHDITLSDLWSLFAFPDYIEMRDAASS